MQSLKWLAIALAVSLVASNAQAQQLDESPENEAQDQLEAFTDEVPEREIKAGIEELTVTAQRRSESLQEVPIAVTAFNAEALEMQQITQFSDLQFSAPNVSFTKTNFTGSNFTIRGIGSAAVAASGSPGVAFHINEAALTEPIFETEYFDIERIEILRGPQGTLYGQSATGGVVNVITKKPVMGEWGGNVELEYGNFETFKVRGAVNVPLGERVALRVAGLSLQRDGMIENLYDGSDIGGDTVDGRDLYSLRVTLAADVTDTTSAYFMWSRFHEDDNRARITNQRCNPTDTPQLGCDWRGTVDTMLAEPSYPQASAGNIFAAYSGLAPFGPTPAGQGPVPANIQQELNQDFRKVYTDMDPVYQTTSDLYLLSVDQELPADMMMSLLAGYQGGDTLSYQDYNMDVGTTFNPTDKYPQGVLPVSGPKPFDQSDENLLGIFDNQIYRYSDRVFAYDQSWGEASNWYTELQANSDWDGMFNFLAGFNYAHTKTKGSYRVLANTLEAIAVDAAPIQNPQGPIPAIGASGLFPSFFDNATGEYERTGMGFYTEGYLDVTADLKLTGGFRWNYDKKSIYDRSTLFNALAYDGAVGTPPSRTCLLDTNPFSPGNQPDYACIAGLDPQPIGPALYGVNPPGALPDLGPCDSWPGQDEGAPNPNNCAYLPGASIPGWNEARYLKGSPTEETWNAFTGRFVVDYALELPFTDETLTYFSWSRGYRPGGFNPPVNTQQPGFQGVADVFDPEFVNAFEIAAKNTFVDLGLQANFTAFFYDYKGYQISKIANRTSINENIDAFVWGLEIESLWAPPILPGAMFNFNFSYLGSEVSSDYRSTDPRDPNGERHYESTGQANPNFLLKDSIFAQPCPVDKEQYIDAYLDGRLEGDAAGYQLYVDQPITFATVEHRGQEVQVPTLANCGGLGAVPGRDGKPVNIVQGPDGGTREYAYQLKGNELPNAPKFSFNMGAQYTFPIQVMDLDMYVIPRTDFYWQSSMWGRVFNAPLDKIPSWYRWDMQLILEDAEARWFVRGYVKNLLNDDNVTGLYVSDAATANFTNVFTIEPRIFGFAVGANF